MPKLKNAPIIEAVLDIDCDMPPGQEISTLEASARASFQPQYPKFQTIFNQELRLEPKLGAPAQVSTLHKMQGLQFLQDDGRQLVQVRTQGFSFNRLAPYSTLDDYLQEMERTWNLFVKLASPVQVRVIRLRYINRILLPKPGVKVQLDDYLKIGPHLPDEEKFELIGFLHQHAAVEVETKNQVNIILAAQPPENDMLPLIFDITAASATTQEPGNWAAIAEKIQSLRHLKNRVFRNTITEKCISLFQQ